MGIYAFKRRDGSTLRFELTVNTDKLATDITRKLAMTGREALTKCDGAIVAKVIKD